MDPADRKRLQSLWLKLLPNITDYKGITDGLFAEGILTPALKEKVLEKKGTDQLREILDILPRRGPKAMRVFYEVLVDCGEDVAADLLHPELAAQRMTKQDEKRIPLSGVQESRKITGHLLAEDDELPEKWPDIDSHDPFNVNVVNVSEGDQPMRARFEKAAAGNGAVYCMDKPVRGICLLLNNEDFKEARANGVNLSDREGTDKDFSSLETLFTKLGFRIISEIDLSAQNILEAVQDQCSQDHTNYNCFVCIVLSHGERDIIYGVDGKTIALLKLRDAVINNCRTLIGKPKLFFIQACQGKLHDKGCSAVDGCGAAGLDPQLASVDTDLNLATDKFVKLSVEDETESDDAGQGRVSSESEIFVAMATVPGFVSWRNKKWGTWFIQAVVFVFSRLACKYDLPRLMTRVNQLVSRAESQTGYKQVSIFKSSFTRDFYFFPGLQRKMVSSHSETDMVGETKEFR